MKIFEKIGRVLDDVTSVDADPGVWFGGVFFTVAFLVLLWVLVSPIAAVLAILSPFAGVVLFCILSFLKELSRSVRRHFFEK